MIFYSMINDAAKLDAITWKKDVLTKYSNYTATEFWQGELPPVFKDIERVFHTVRDGDHVHNYLKECGIPALLLLMLEPGFVFGLKKLPAKTQKEPCLISTESDVFINLMLMKGKSVTKKEAQNLANSCSDKAFQVINWILAGKCPAKLGAALVNSVWPGLITMNLYMGGTPMSTKALKRMDWDSGVLSEVKENGMALMAHVGRYLSVRLLTRNNIDLTEYYGYLQEAIVNKYMTVYTALGCPEFIRDNTIVMHFEMFLEDTDGNDLNVALNNTSIMHPYTVGKHEWIMDDTVQTQAPNVHLVLLDFYAEGIPFTVLERFDAMCTASPELYSGIPSVTVSTVRGAVHYHMADAIKFGADLIRTGGEGAMHKQANQTFKDGKPSWVVKQKNEFEVELKVQGLQEHSTREGLTGALHCVTKDSKLQVDVGGLSENIMRSADLLLYKIVTVRAEAIITDKYMRPTLKHPRYVCMRPDKDVADTYEEVVAQFEASLLSTLN